MTSHSSLSLHCGIDFGHTLIWTGFFNLLTAMTFRIPMPVQPMKAILAADKYFKALRLIQFNLTFPQKTLQEGLELVAAANRDTWKPPFTKVQEEKAFAEELAKRTRSAARDIRQTELTTPTAAWLRVLWDDAPAEPAPSRAPQGSAVPLPTPPEPQRVRDSRPGSDRATQAKAKKIRKLPL